MTLIFASNDCIIMMKDKISKKIKTIIIPKSLKQKKLILTKLLAKSITTNESNTKGCQDGKVSPGL